MNNEVLSNIPNSVVELFEAFDDDYLADVLRVWNCDAQDWHDPFTTVFRFESDDLLVWNDGGSLRCRQGAVDTSSVDCLALNMLSSTEMVDSCLCWLPDTFFRSHIGEKRESHNLLETFI